MNMEAQTTSSSSSSDSEHEDAEIVRNGENLNGDTNGKYKELDSFQSPATESESSRYSANNRNGKSQKDDKNEPIYSKDHSLQEEDQGTTAKVNGVIPHSESGSSVAEKASHGSSVTTTSDQELLKSILSDSSSDQIDTDIEVVSPKDRKSSSSSQEELLREFREKHSNRRNRPASAKLKYKQAVEPAPEFVQRVPSRTGERRSNNRLSHSSDSATSTDNSASERRPAKESRKSSGSSPDLTSALNKDERSHSASSDSSAKSSVSRSGKEQEPLVSTQKTKSSSRSYTSSSSSGSEETEKLRKVEPTQPAERRTAKNSSSESNTSESLTIDATSPSRSTLQQQRPPSRQEKRRYPTRASARIGRPRTRAQPAAEKKTSIEQALWRRSQPLQRDPRTDWPKEPGFWWPYNEDCKGERQLQKLIEYHRKKLNNLLAQEYLQRHLELELKQAGARFQQYERGPKPLPPKQVTKFKERNITWIFLDGKLYNLNSDDMGSWNAKQRGRRRSKVLPNNSKERSSKSSDRSKRSVSFEKGAGKRTNGKKGKRRRGSGSSKDSRKSSISSKESARTRSRSSSGTFQMEYGRGTRVRSRSGTRSRSSSKSSRHSSRGSSMAFNKNKSADAQPERPKTALRRPKTAKGKLRSLSSASGSTAGRVRDKEAKKSRSKSKSGDERTRSKSRDSSKKSANKHYGIEENPKLERALFTEEFEKKLKRRENKLRTKKMEEEKRRSKSHKGSSTGHHDVTATDHNRTSSDHVRDDYPTPPEPRHRAPVDDYNFYRNPNIPGHAFPQYYLAQLLSSRKKNKRQYYDDDTQYVLLPAPVNRSPPWRSFQPRSQRTVRKPKSSRSKPTSSPKLRRQKKTKSIINEKDEEKKARSSSRESGSSSRTRSQGSNSHPRIRPGSGPIKCSWNGETEQQKKKFPGSDHQLKNTDNPTILSWLKHKDAQLRARRHDEMRRQRRKTEKLIDEQNDLEEKHELALQQYEIWKKNKDREILLRRRKEAKEANSASISRKEAELKAIKRKDRPRTAVHIQPKPSSSSTFSELRSSSARPAGTEETVSQTRKPRPKSANIPGISFDANVYEKNQRPRSATPTRKNAGTSERSQGKANQQPENFMETFLVSSSNSKVNENNSKQENQPQEKITSAEDRAAYDKWVRSSPNSRRNQVNSNGNREAKKKKSKKNRSEQHQLPSHSHTDNELISNLAKRRIDSILASHKSVDTGLKRRPASSKNGRRKVHTLPKSDPTYRKWKLREDDIVVKPVVRFGSENSIQNTSSSSSSSSSNSDDEKRPKFSYKKKTHSSSTRHHRNPVIRDAVEQQ